MHLFICYFITYDNSKNIIVIIYHFSIYIFPDESKPVVLSTVIVVAESFNEPFKLLVVIM